MNKTTSLERVAIPKKQLSVRSINSNGNFSNFDSFNNNSKDSAGFESCINDDHKANPIDLTNFDNEYPVALPISPPIRKEDVNNLVPEIQI